MSRTLLAHAPARRPEKEFKDLCGMTEVMPKETKPAKLALFF